MIESQRLFVLVTRISEKETHIPTMEGLLELIKGLVSAFDLTTLQGAILRALRLDTAETRAKGYSKNTSSRDKG